MQNENLDFLKQKELALKEFERLYNPPKDKVLSPNVKIEIEEEKPCFGPNLKTKPKQNFGIDLFNVFNFKKLNLNHEALIIVALIFLLSNEKGDKLLILALLYILL